MIFYRKSLIVVDAGALEVDCLSVFGYFAVDM